MFVKIQRDLTKQIIGFRLLFCRVNDRPFWHQFYAAMIGNASSIYHSTAPKRPIILCTPNEKFLHRIPRTTSYYSVRIRKPFKLRKK